MEVLNLCARVVTFAMAKLWKNTDPGLMPSTRIRNTEPERVYGLGLALSEVKKVAPRTFVKAADVAPLVIEIRRANIFSSGISEIWNNHVTV